MKIAVIGATGVLGRQVTPRLVERGHSVRAIVLKPGEAERLRRTGIEAVLGDILEPDTLTTGTAGCEAALHLATSVPRPGQAQDWRLNDRIRTLFRYVAAQVNGPEPQPSGEVFLPSLGCSNTRIKDELGWEPVFATYRAGLA